MKDKPTRPEKEKRSPSPEQFSAEKAPSAQTDSTSSSDGKAESSGLLKRLLLLCLIAFCLIGVVCGVILFLHNSGMLTAKESTQPVSSGTQVTTTQETPATQETTTATEDTTSETTTTAPEEPEGDLSGYTIILDAGHGGKDSGCVFPFNNPQYNECDFNLTIALRTKDELESRGATVYLTRSDDSWISLYSRPAQAHLICMDIAKEEGILPFTPEREAELRTLLQETIDINDGQVSSGGMGIMVGSGFGEDLLELVEMEYQLDQVLFLSIHLNSNEKRTLHGTQIYYVTDESVIESEHHLMKTDADFRRSDFPIREDYYGRKHNEDNNLLAWCLYDNIVGYIEDFETNATPVVADNYAVLREHGLAGALIEVAYLTDDHDRELLQQDEVIDDLARAIGDGVKMYFEQMGI